MAALTAAAAAALRTTSSAPVIRRAETLGRAMQGDGVAISEHKAVMARKGNLDEPVVRSKPNELHLKAAHGKVFDVRALTGTVVKRERPEHPAPGETSESGTAAGGETASDPDAGLPAAVDPNTINAFALADAAPSTDANFEGLDFANWGAGHPPDTNGDVGPTYYIQTINSSIGIFDKSTGTRVAAFTFDSFMSQGNFGNSCDTNNSGDPVVLYDSFENRWFITDFAYKLDASGNISPQHVFQCFAVSKTGDPVSGGWNFYSIESPGGADDYAKFGIWPDGVYMSANMFGYSAPPSFIAPHVWAINKMQMYAGEPSAKVADFAAPVTDFTLLPSNARLQAGTPPPGTPDYFVSTWQFLNGVTVYKFHVDWDKISTSTFTGPEFTLNATSWPNQSVANASTPGNSLDVLQVRAMAQNQYSNIGGVESLWATHTVRRALNGSAAPRWYQLDVTGGTVAAATVQGTTWDPDGADTFSRFVPSLAVDRAGDMALGYSKSSSTTNPQIKYAGRLAGDAVNTFSQTEQTLIDGTGTQVGNCGGSTCTRWGDYSGMSLDPDGCTFWETNEYYAVDGLDHHTRIGSFLFPGCTTVGGGTLSGTVTDGGTPIAGATVALGSRTTTTDGTGNYSFSVPAGTYPAITARKAGFDSDSFSSVVVPDGGTAAQDFTLNAAAVSGCFTDDTQNAFQRGIPSGCDLTSSPGTVELDQNVFIDQQNTNVSTSGFGFSSTTWVGQTFTPAVTAPVTRIDLDLFCSGCTGTTPNLTVSIRATAGSLALPTGGDLATATIPGFSSGADGYFSANFASPVTLTAGTRYAVIVRPVSNPSAGTYAYVLSSANPYANGQRVGSPNSGSTWAADTTSGGRDLGFKVWVDTGFAPSGTLVSSVKDANPAAGHIATWTTLSFTATEPAGTDVQFQVAASNNSYGPFNFVGPDGTASTFFTTSGADLGQFHGMRYLRYKVFLSTTSASVSPTLSDVTVCFDDHARTSLAVDPATGTYGGTATLSATLAAVEGVSGEGVDFTLNGSSVGSATTDANGVATLSNVSLSGIDAGSYPTGVGASFAGDNDYGPSSGSNPLTISKAVLSVKPDPSTASRQYSDVNPSFSPEIKGFVNGDDASALTADPTCSSATSSSGPSSYPITCSGGAAVNYSFSYTGGTLAVAEEDARATYNGNNLFWTSSPSSTNANVTLSATVRDITAVTGDPAYDAYAGDIRNAKVTFVNRDTNTAFAGCSNLPVGLVFGTATMVGSASCSTTLAAANTTGATQYTVGIVVGGYYTQNAAAEDDVIDVAQPLTSNFITGGGNLLMSDSAGQDPGNVGSKTNFGFNVKYNKNGTNLQGNVNAIVRSGARVYQIKGNAISSLGVATPKANFTGKASIQDVTDPLNPLPVDGNATLQLWMTDVGEPGSNDTLGIQVLNKSGGVWFSSSWNGTKTVEQKLGGGNLVVH